MQLIPNTSNTVFSKTVTSQPCFIGSNGTTWTDVDSTNLSLSFMPPAGSWTAFVSANADLWTSTAGYNQDIGISLAGGGAYPTVPGQPEAWKESGGKAGTYSPNAALVHVALPVAGGSTYTARLQWKANQGSSGAIHGGAGPIGGNYSPTTILVVLVPATSTVASSNQQYTLANSDGSTWQPVDLTRLKLTLAPSSDSSYQVAANADLWTSVAGYNQDLHGVARVEGQPRGAIRQRDLRGRGTRQRALLADAADRLAAELMKARLAASGGCLILAAGLVVAQPQPAHAAVVPGTTCSVFPPDNIWNTDISTLPVNTNSGTWVASTTPSSGKLHPDFGGPPYGIPFNVVDNTHATTTFTFQYASESDPGPYPYGSDLLIEQGSDAHLLSINKNTCKLYETFATNQSGPSTAGSGAIFALASNALRPAGWTSADAAGLPIFPGLVRLDEVQAGLIAHAIRFTVHNTDAAYLWPARHQAGVNNAALPPMGARFRLKTSYDISAFGPEAQVVLMAMKHYGLIVADNGSDWFFQGTEDAGWNSGPYPAMISQLKTIPVSAFEAVDESLLMVNPNSAQAGLTQPTSVTATAGDGSAGVTWSAPSSSGGSPVTSYVITAYDGCTIQGSTTVTGSPPATNVTFTGLTNGTAYTFRVAAVNGNGTGPQSQASNVVVPSGAAPSWVSGCSTAQYRLTGSDGATWHDLDASNLAVSFTPAVDSWAVLSANADLWTANAGYNQDLGIAVGGGVYPTFAGQPEAWKESGGFAGTFSPNAAYAHAIIPVLSGVPYSARLQWKTNQPDPGTIFAGAGPIAGAYSPTRLTVQLVPNSSPLVISRKITTQPGLTGNDGRTWQDVDTANLSLGFTPPAGNWWALTTANADLWTSTAGYNQDIGISVTGGAFPSAAGQPEAWKESGGGAGTFSPNAAFVQTGLPVAGLTSYVARLQWKASHGSAGSIHIGAGPTAGSRYSVTTLAVILVPRPANASVAASTQQYPLANSDGSTWRAMDLAALNLPLAPGANTSYAIAANADLWTAVAGYNQDLGIMVSGGAYGSGTVVAWKESGGFAGINSPNAAFVTTDLHLQPATTYAVWIVWKASRPPSGNTTIYAGAGPINSMFSPTSLTAVVLSSP